MASKYQQIYGDLKSGIQSGKLAAGTYLPSEKELMAEYEASRDTIRKALLQLANAGFIQKEKGKGSLILETDTISFPVSGLTSFKELQSSNIHGSVRTIVESFELKEPDERIRKKLNMESGGMIYDIRRVREIDGERIIYDHDYINANLIPGLTREDAADSVYEYIEKKLGLTISFARKEITVIPADHRDRKLLDMKDYDLLVCVKSYNFLEDASLFCYTVSKHRPDKFQFIDFSRRENVQ